MQQETELYFDRIVRDDRPVMELVKSDYTFLNEPLAKHYGIPDVTGDAMRMVKLSAGPRGGVLGHASVLMLTSNPGRTSPVKRGKWVLENILMSVWMVWDLRWRTSMRLVGGGILMAGLHSM
jgi:hypothetical protein